jgi:hypothetical protein
VRNRRVTHRRWSCNAKVTTVHCNAYPELGSPDWRRQFRILEFELESYVVCAVTFCCRGWKSVFAQFPTSCYNNSTPHSWRLFVCLIGCCCCRHRGTVDVVVQFGGAINSQDAGSCVDGRQDLRSRIAHGLVLLSFGVIVAGRVHPRLGQYEDVQSLRRAGEIEKYCR